MYKPLGQPETVCVDLPLETRQISANINVIHDLESIHQTNI